MNMELRKVTADFPDMGQLDDLALEAFPPEEYLAPEKILELSRKSQLDFWGAYDNERFVGFCVIARHRSMAYLFFLAITPENRSKGYGSSILSLLSENYKSCQLTVDLEMVDEDAPNYVQRHRRKEFYLKNGFKETGLYLTYFGVSYEVLCRDSNFNIQIFKNLLFSIPIDGFNPIFFTKSDHRLRKSRAAGS